MATVPHLRQRKRGGRRGHAAVEFALILPLLVTIVLGCVDFGRFAYTYIAVTNAARTGAGAGSANLFTATTLARWQALVQSAAAGEMCPPAETSPTAFDSSKIAVTAPVVTTEANGQKRVRVTVSYPFTTLVNWPFLPHSVTVQQSAEMRIVVN